MDSTTECTIYLLSLTSVQDFVTALAELPEKPLIAARNVHWIFPPSNLGVDDLTKAKWDMVVCFAGSASLPASLEKYIQSSWTVTFAAPSSFVTSLAATQAELAANVPARSRELDLLTDLGGSKLSSVDSAEMTPELKDWMESFSEQENHPPIMMFNLLAFKDIEKYKKYQGAFTEKVGVRHGARPLLYGAVTAHSGDAKEWEMTAFVYYPSVLHFADLLASPDYREASHQYRQGSLIDNPLMCLVNI